MTDRSAWIRQILKGDVRAVARLLTLIQNQSPAARPLLKALFPHTGRARLLGITGPAGAGKSTLINQLITAFRKKGCSIGVLAVDPTSPLSGGALLGDRLRMQPHFLDRQVFIRSLAARGGWGGISPALFEAIHLLDAMGKEIILIETVGVGQDEVEIARLADRVVLVLAPGMGDDIQLMKAGLLEIGDLVVVNKGDLKEARSLFHRLREALPDRPLLQVAAEKGKEMPALFSAIEAQLGAPPSPARRRAFIREELRTLLRESLGNAIEETSFGEREIESVLLRRRDPYSLIRAWIRRGEVKPFS